MSTEWLNVVVSVATVVVETAASVAAIVQLRHLRTSNQLNALLEIMNQWNVPMVQEALAELLKVPEKMKDPQYVALLSSPRTIDRKTHLEFLALDLWEQIGTYCKHGLIDENILLDVTSGQVSRGWECAEPAITILRKTTGPSSMENFEYLAVRAKLWAEKY